MARGGDARKLTRPMPTRTHTARMDALLSLLVSRHYFATRISLAPGSSNRTIGAGIRIICAPEPESAL